MANNDVSPTDWASEKFRAEVEQIRASIEVERQKAASAVAREQAEVASLNAPFYKKSSFWTTVVPIITATATVFFYLNNQFNADYAKMKSDLDRTKVELLQANADLADFKNQRAEQQLKEAQDQKAMVAKQIAGANSQLDLLKKQLAEESEKLGDAPIVTLIDAVIRRSESEFPRTSWEDALQGQLLELAMANPNSPALLQEGIDSTTNFATKAQFIVIAFDAAGDVKFREALFDLGKLAISQKVSDYAFWSIFSAPYGKPFDQDMEREACSLLMDAYVAGVTNAGDDEGRMADSISSALNYCDPADQEGWAPVVEAARKRMVGAPITPWLASSTALIMAAENPLAGALLFADRWNKDGFRDEDWLSNATSLILGVEGSAIGPLGASSNSSDWKQFYEAHLDDLAAVKSKPIDEWPTL